MNKESKNRDYWRLVWDKFRKGDREAFDEIYQEFADVLFVYGMKIVNNRDLIQDCIQDLFVGLYKYGQNLDNPDYLEFYLFKSLKRAILRRQKRDLQYEPVNETDFRGFDLRFNLEDEIIEAEAERNRVESLTQVLNQLDAQKRELLFLKFNSDLNYVEIGKLLEMKPDTVKKQVYRLLAYIRDNFGPQLLNLFIAACKK